MSKTTYTPELAAKFCAAIADGGSLRAVCAKKDMPSKATVFRWLRDQPEFVKLYEQATDDRADAHVDEIIDIADKCKVDKDAVAKAKLQIYARIEAVQRMKPRKYGARVTQELVGAGGGAIQVQSAAALTDDQLAAIAAGAKCS
jgi:hypothetical protein